MKNFTVSITDRNAVTVQADDFRIGSFHNATFYRIEQGVAVASHYFASVQSVEVEEPPTTQREQVQP